MIKNYHDDASMAEYGRLCARYKAINQAKELIRDNSVRIMNSKDIEEIKQYHSEINQAVSELIEAIELE